MNALQQLIADYLSDNPGESYASIGRRGSLPTRPLPRSTVHSLATKPSWRQTPNPVTLEALARGMDMNQDRVRLAAADAAGYRASVSSEVGDGRARLVVEATQVLDPERLEILARRARFLLAEMQEEQQPKG